MNKRNRRPSKAERQRQAKARVESVLSAFADVLDPAATWRATLARHDADRLDALRDAINAEPARDLWIHPFMRAPQDIAHPVDDVGNLPTPKRRTRRINLTVAMDTMRRALARTLKRQPSAREVWNAFGVTPDPTGAVVTVDDEFISWRGQDGAPHKTKFKTFSNRYSTLLKK